ncbi:MAG: TatD family hydrolase [Prevotellaceae bacterium]|nr:TatD family hydrolase [Prevotellaceae bacterium]
MTTPFIDFHTHHPASIEGETAIVDGRDTWGIHPWTLNTPPTPPDGGTILAIGECGIDKLCSSPLALQREAFLRCISESQRLRKPLFLHCVRAIDECLALRREAHATEPWIWHGFRGGATQLHQLLPHGFYFSFGFRFRKEALLACPLPRLLLESDTDPRPVSHLYQRASLLLGISPEALASQMRENYLSLFFRHQYS